MEWKKINALSTREAESIAVMKLIESSGMGVRKTMMVHSDNKGAVHLINGWSVGDGTKHIDCRIMLFERRRYYQGTLDSN